MQRNRAVAPITAEAWVLYYLKRLLPAVVSRVNRALTERVRRGVPEA